MPSCKASVGSSTPTLLFLDLRTHGGGIKWPRAGAILADHYSLAWRTMDAQHWGVPQRRLRISLVLDLTGGRAGEILFEPESLRGHFAPGVTAGQATAGTVENGAGTADCTDAIPVNLQIATRHKSLGERTGLGVGQAGDAAYTLQEGHEHGVCCPDIAKAYTLKIRSGCEGGGKGALVQTEKSATLSTLQDQTLFVAESPDSAKNQGGIAIVEPTFCIQGNTIDRADTAGANGAGVKEDVCYTLNTIDRPAVAFALNCRNMTANEELSATLQAKGNGGQSLNYINPVAEPLIYDARGNGDGITSPTMTGDHNSRVTDYTAITLQGDTVAGALLARDYKGPGRADSLGRVIAQPVGADLYNGTLTGDKAATLTTATGQGGANTGPSVIEKIIRWIVRRLTPTECERLQGYPDGWTARARTIRTLTRPDIKHWVTPSPCRSGTTFSAASLIVCRRMLPLEVYLMESAVSRMCGHSYTLGAKSCAFGPRRLRSFPSRLRRNGSRR